MLERKVGITKDSPITILEMPGGNSIYGRYRLSRAAPLLTGILDEAGYTNVTTIDPQYNTLPGGFVYRGKLTGRDWYKITPSKALLISTLTSTAPESERIAREYLKANPEGKVIVGGPHVSLAAEDCLKWGKSGQVIVVRGEAEKTLPALLNALEENGSSKGVEGTSYKEGDAVVHESDRRLLTEIELSNSPQAIYSKAAERGSRVRLHYNSRGCTHRCYFCTVPILNKQCYRMKSDEAIYTEFDQSYLSNPKRPIFYIDDNFAANPRQTEAFLKRNISLGMTERELYVQLRAEIGLRRGFAELLKEAGVKMIAIGVESVFDDTLQSIHKGVSAENTKKGVRALREAGIWVHGMFIVGLDKDMEQDPLGRLRYTLEWAKENVDTAQFFPPVPIPGTVFTREMKEQDRILTEDYSLYNGDHVIIRPKNMSPYDLQMAIYDMLYGGFYSFDRIEDPVGHIKERLKDPSSEEWRTFWRDCKARAYANYTLWRLTRSSKTRQHIEDLKEQSKKVA